MVKVSVIIPVYNSERYLEECLDSVIHQTLKDIEIIVVNDGSTDSSLEICKRFEEKDTRVRLLSIPNSGSAAARNVGLAHVHGEYIGFVDSDDWVEREMFERLYEKARLTNADIVGCNFMRHFPSQEIKNHIKYRSGLYNREQIVKEIFPELIGSKRLTVKAPTNMVTKIFKCELIRWNEIQFDERLLGGQDVVFASTCILHSDSLYLMNEAYYYHYRYNPNSRTNTYLPGTWEVFDATRDYYSNLLANYNEYDFSKQLELSKLSGVLTAINYEVKPGNPKRLVEKYRLIKEICNELHGDEVFLLVNYRELDFRRKVAVYCVERKWAFALLLFGRLNTVLRVFWLQFKKLTIFK